MFRTFTIIASVVILGSSLASAQDVARVTVDNFARAESDTYLRANMEAFGIGVGKLHHIREPVTPENQPVIRMNQDTIYSGLVLDLSRSVRFTLPDVGSRYISMHVVNQDHYMFVKSKPGTYELTEESVGTRFALVTVRTFVNPNDPADIKKAHAAQDAIMVEGGGNGPLDAPNWDQASLKIIRESLSNVAELGFSSTYAFGRKEETEPVAFLLGTASGWGGLPRSAAMYEIDSVAQNDGQKPHVVTASDVPVDAFWSITVYNDQGFLETNDLGVNSYNNHTAKPNTDGSITIHFGECEDGRINCIPITTGWNYVVRMYEPHEEIQNGSWEFPQPKPIK